MLSPRLAVHVAHPLVQRDELLADLREPLVDLALAGLQLLLPATGLLLQLGLVVGDQLLDARPLDLALHAREVGVQRRDDPLGLPRVKLRGTSRPWRWSSTATRAIRTIKSRASR